MVAERAVVDARPSVVFPVTSRLLDTERFVVEALASVDWPVTFKVPDNFPLVA